MNEKPEKEKFIEEEIINNRPKNFKIWLSNFRINLKNTTKEEIKFKYRCDKLRFNKCGYCVVIGDEHFCKLDRNECDYQIEIIQKEKKEN